MKDIIGHYDNKYFSWQGENNKFGAKANKFMFEKLIKKKQRILDFGCSSGAYLNEYKNIKKYGVEVNPFAREIAIKNGINCYSSSKELPNNFFDLIISSNVLEHTENPLQELNNLYKSLKPNGHICIVVPIDNKSYPYKKNDIHFHLFSWSPMNLGNILNAAGFDVIESKTLYHKWIPKYELFVKIFGWKFFHVISIIYAHLKRDWFQVRAIAVKKTNS